MKTKILLLALLCTVFATQIQAQNRTTINAKNSEISDNLDLRVVASIFGDSNNLQDFERRLNDPKLQISNLDLNDDDQVDYLRVIESVENGTHVIIIQSVLDRDVYQDVASIEVEKDRYNEVHVQVVGNAYMYGQNYIYEPVYYRTPFIYATFWTSNYRPYYSSWSWNIYPSYYYAWNPFPIFRYRSNVNICLNTYNNYNYVNNRRSTYAVNLYNSRRSNAYERQYPNYSFARRNSGVNNRYELDQRRNTRTIGYSTRGDYSQNKVQSQRSSSQRDYTTNRVASQRDYTQNRTASQRSTTPQRTEPQRDYTQNRVASQRSAIPQRTEAQRDYTQNRATPERTESNQRTETQRDYTQNRVTPQRTESNQRTETQRDNSQNRAATQRDFSQNNAPSQRVETQRASSSQRSDSQRDNSSRSSNRRT